MLLVLLSLSAYVALIDTNASAADDATNYSCSGQVMMAKWVVGDVTVNAVFAEQLKTDDGAIFQNALFVNVVHANLQVPYSENIVESVILNS